MESLYAIYSPLWLQEPGGKITDLFYNLVMHFNSCATYKQSKSTSLQKVLSNGSGKMFDLAHDLRPQSFVHGKFLSCDFFLELVMDTKLNSLNILAKLFTVNESRK